MTRNKKTFFSERREFLRKTFTTVPTAVAGYALIHSTLSEAASPSPAPVYQPQFFTTAEWLFIHAAVARLIPNDELGVGAIEAGVPEFIDRQMEAPYGHGALWYMQGPFVTTAAPEFGHQLKLVPREIYRLGIAAVNHWTQTQHRAAFHELSIDLQDELLQQLEQGTITLAELPSSLLFSQLLQNTREGFFSDPQHGGNRGLAGWKLVGFPGARADFMDWVERNERYPFAPVAISGQRG